MSPVLHWHLSFLASWFGNSWSSNITDFKRFAPTANSSSSLRARCVPATSWPVATLNVSAAIPCAVGLPPTGYGFLPSSDVSFVPTPQRTSCQRNGSVAYCVFRRLLSYPTGAESLKLQHGMSGTLAHPSSYFWA